MQQEPDNTRVRSTGMIWATRLIMLYPVAWRERYADEMLIILEEHPPTFWTLGDLLFNLCDAHLHTDIVPTGMLNMLKRIHSSSTMIFYASILFWFSSLLTLAVLTYFHGIGPGRPDIIGLPTYDQSMMINTVTSTIFPILLLFFGMQLLFSTGWQALKTRHIRPFFLYLFGLLSLGITVAVSGYLVLVFIVDQSMMVNTLAFIILPILLLLFSMQRLFAIGWQILKTRRVRPFRYLFSLLSLGIAVAFSGLLVWIMVAARPHPVKLEATILVTLAFVFIVWIGIWALKIALPQTVPGTRLTHFTLVPATAASLTMLVHTISLPLVLYYEFTTRAWISVMFMSIPIMIMLYTWHLLLRCYQDRRALKFTTQ